jgi:Winged helix-turn helix
MHLECGVVSHPTHGGRLLHAIRRRPQKPMRRARQRDEAALAHWREEPWPVSNKGHKASRTASSSAMHRASLPCLGWCAHLLPGGRPPLSAWWRRDQVSALAAVSPEGRLSFHRQERARNSADGGRSWHTCGGRSLGPWCSWGMGRRVTAASPFNRFSRTARRRASSWTACRRMPRHYILARASGASGRGASGATCAACLCRICRPNDERASRVSVEPHGSSQAFAAVPTCRSSCPDQEDAAGGCGRWARPREG